VADCEVCPEVDVDCVVEVGAAVVVIVGVLVAGLLVPMPPQAAVNDPTAMIATAPVTPIRRGAQRRERITAP
jgi:hypothetical protein